MHMANDGVRRLEMAQSGFLTPVHLPFGGSGDGAIPP
jgi:hypothetical protein